MSAYLSAEGAELSPGDRVEHSDGRIGSVYRPSWRPAHVIVKWDDGGQATTACTFLHLIRKKGSK